MFTLEELLVRPNDDIPLLIEKRATLFLSKLSYEATTVYMSPDVYTLLLKQHYSLGYKNGLHGAIASSHPMNVWRTTKCDYMLQVLWHTQNLLMLADKTQYDLYLYNNGMPADILTAYENQQLDKAIETLLIGKEKECLQPWVTSCGSAMKKDGSHLETAISRCVNVLTALFQKTCILLRLG